jgi:ubiquitin-like protein Pup
MTEQQKKEGRTSKAVEGTDGDGASAKLAKKGKKLAADAEKILDEIDAVLEENAEEFVKNYVQRGGE